MVDLHLSGWLSVWLIVIDWLLDGQLQYLHVTKRLTVYFADWLTDQLIAWPSDWMNNWMSHWLIN